MKRFLTKTLFLLIIALFNSCAVFNSFLELDDCDHPDCDKERVNNCNYCMIHCDIYNVPKDFNSKVGKSIDKQIEQYRKRK